MDGDMRGPRRDVGRLLDSYEVAPPDGRDRVWPRSLFERTTPYDDQTALARKVIELEDRVRRLERILGLPPLA
jgi:hypothetical protein